MSLRLPIDHDGQTSNPWRGERRTPDTLVGVASHAGVAGHDGVVGGHFAAAFRASAILVPVHERRLCVEPNTILRLTTALLVVFSLLIIKPPWCFTILVPSELQKR